MDAFVASHDRPAPRWRRAVWTPTVLQMETVECGAAALAMILGHYRRFAPLAEVRAACGVSRDGSRASSILRAARGYGLDASGLRLPLADLPAVKLPFIAFWSDNHFVVVEGRVSRGIRINDPTSGHSVLSAAEFAEQYSGVALEFAPTREFRASGRPPSLLGALIGWTKGSRPALAMIIVATLLLALPTVMLPALVKVFVDEVLIRRFDNWLFPIVITLVLAILLGATVNWLQQSVLMRLQMKLAVVVGARFLWHVLRLPLLFFTQRQSGDIVNRVHSADQLALLLAGPLPTAIAQAAMVILYGAAMALYCPPLMVASVLLASGNVIAVVFLRRRLNEASMAKLNIDGKIEATATAGLQLIETIKAMSSEADFFRVWSGYQARNANQVQRLGRLSMWMGTVPMLLGQLMTAMVLGYGALLIIDGHLSIGGLVAFQMLLGNFMRPLQQIIDVGPQLQEAKAHLTRLEDVLAAKIDPLLVEAPASAPLPLLSGEIELKGVSFAYAPFDRAVLQDINLRIERGQRVALVGGSGSGKSTLVKLLLGLHVPSSGTICYDGRPLSSLPRAQFTTSVAWVDQDICPFEGTVRDNLTLFSSATPPTWVARAAQDACIHDAILARPGGYDGDVLEGGANFSGGQRQRLEIARALAREPSIMVLDEATAALDAITETQIDHNIRRRGLTCIIVAQRLSTIRDCDQIIVLEHGTIAARGTHQQLVAAGGTYAELVGAA